MTQQDKYVGVMRYIAGKKRAEEALGFLAALIDVLDADAESSEKLSRVVTTAVPTLGSSARIRTSGTSDIEVTSGEGAEPSEDSTEVASEAPSAIRSAPSSDVSVLRCSLQINGSDYGSLTIRRHRGADPFDAFDRALVAETARIVALWCSSLASTAAPVSG